ncbi:MAG TPA: hypothetical protein VN840_08530 [Streptosporangiaceae bacterium]|nr:hypothetical protein [Streptosporangiaceae bacterium]
MASQPIMLKVLLGQRHWQNYATFCAEYDKAARKLDPELAGTFPSRAQLHRWLNGSLRGLPYADHCRVLEEMLTGWNAEQLFQPATPDLLYAGPHASGQSTQAQAHPAGPPVFAAPSVGIRPFIEQAFAREHVSVDFAGFSGETLHGVIQEPLDKIRIGRIRPASVTVRLLLPDTTRPMTLPCRADDLSDDPEYRQRATRLTARHAHAIIDSVHELAQPGILTHAKAEIRAHSCSPLFKLYILNGEDMFFGLYPILRHTIPLPGGDRDIYDFMGKDAMVFHHSVHSGQPTDIPYVEHARTWFATMWDTISYEYPA